MIRCVLMLIINLTDSVLCMLLLCITPLDERCVSLVYVLVFCPTFPALKTKTRDSLIQLYKEPVCNRTVQSYIACLFTSRWYMYMFLLTTLCGHFVVVCGNRDNALKINLIFYICYCLIRQ